MGKTNSIVDNDAIMIQEIELMNNQTIVFCLLVGLFQRILCIMVIVLQLRCSQRVLANPLQKNSLQYEIDNVRNRIQKMQSRLFLKFYKMEKL